MKAKANWTGDIDNYSTKHMEPYYKGRSMNYVGTWTEGTRYFSDEFVVDFVSFEGCLLACKQTNTAQVDTIPVIQYNDHHVPIGLMDSTYWQFVMPSGTNATAYDIYVKHLLPEETPLTEEEWIRQMMNQIITTEEAKMEGVPEVLIEDAVRYDKEQNLALYQQAQGRHNINAANEDEVLESGELIEDFWIQCNDADTVVRTVPQYLSRNEIKTAQENINVADEGRVAYIEQQLAGLSAQGVTTVGDVNNLYNKEHVAAKGQDLYVVNSVNDLLEFVGRMDSTTDPKSDDRFPYIAFRLDDGSQLPNIVNRLNELRIDSDINLEKYTKYEEWFADLRPGNPFADNPSLICRYVLTKGKKLNPTNAASGDIKNKADEEVYIDIFQTLVKDEVTGKAVKMIDPADPDNIKDYANPAEVYADFKDVSQIQLYVNEDTKEMEAKILFEDVLLTGAEIIP